MRGNWIALTIGLALGLLVVVVGGLYLWDLVMEVSLRISEVMQGGSP
jgi:hypothetical protein